MIISSSTDPISSNFNSFRFSEKKDPLTFVAKSKTSNAIIALSSLAPFRDLHSFHDIYLLVLFSLQDVDVPCD